jgi:dihydrofolate synthase/folylpolyglutamate synthase
MVYLPHWPIPHGKKAIDLGLDRIKELLKRLGNPEDNLPPTIHVAGTNGKGSTIAYLKTIFEAAGYRVHRYISPHIVRYNERIMLAGKEIDDNYLYNIMEETRLAAGDLQPTFFEGTTAAAFLAFAKVKADILLLETGLGGRLDATNVVAKPLLSVITPISFDHVEYLGTTIAKIAQEKAGIIKKNSPCVVSWQMEEAMNALLNRCNELDVPAYAWNKNWNFNKVNDGFEFLDFASETKVILPEPNLFGIHQTINAATAVACVKILNSNSNFKLEHQHLQIGVSQARWQARMEKITQGVLHAILPSGWELWVDGAHNTGGAQMVAATIASKWTDKPTYLINGRTGDRDIKGFLEYFKELVPFVCGVKVVSEPKGESAENITAGARELGMEAYDCDSIKHAIELILDKSAIPGRILVVGSLYLAADLMLANKTG